MHRLCQCQQLSNCFVAPRRYKPRVTLYHFEKMNHYLLQYPQHKFHAQNLNYNCFGHRLQPRYSYRDLFDRHTIRIFKILVLPINTTIYNAHNYIFAQQAIL